MPELISVINRELQYRKDLLKQYEAWLSNAPEGRVYFRRNGEEGRTSYYQYKEKGTGKIKRRTIKSEDAAMVAQIKLKLYLSRCLPALRKSVRDTERILDRFEAFDPKQIADSLDDFYTAVPLPLEKIAKDPSGDTPSVWSGLNERQNTFRPEDLRYQAEGGMYRSKSEMLIATQLSRFGIPFKYEPELRFESFRFYPDFAVLNQVENEVVYWEHIGLLDKDEYRRALDRKISTYYFHGIRPGDNLILSCDGEGHPLSALKIERIIRAHFL